VTALVAAPSSNVVTLAALSRVEIRRYLRHPVFLLGLAATAVMLTVFLTRRSTDVDNLVTYPASFLGLFGVMTGYWLALSTQPTAEALDATPTPAHLRTAALSTAAVVPFVAGVVALVAIVAFQPVPLWTQRSVATPDRVTMLVAEVVMSAVGGPLLGVAVARWVRAVWLPPVLFVVIELWLGTAAGLASNFQNSTLVLLVRMFTPFTFFVTANGFDAGEVWRGSPWFYVAWQVCLCALAVTVAMLKDADPVTRRRLHDTLLVVVALCALTYWLAVTGGLSHAVLVDYTGFKQPIL
jgi:hypothetical protein